MERYAGSHRWKCLKAVRKSVCEFYGLSEDLLMGRSTLKAYAHPRKVAMYLARNMTDMSFPNLGVEFERDHTTVQSNVRSINAMVQKEGRVADEVDLLSLRIESIMAGKSEARETWQNQFGHKIPVQVTYLNGRINDVSMRKEFQA